MSEYWTPDLITKEDEVNNYHATSYGFDLFSMDERLSEFDSGHHYESDMPLGPQVAYKSTY